MSTMNRATRAVGMSLFLFAPLGAFADKPTQVEVVNPVDAPVPVRVAVQPDESVTICGTSQLGNPTLMLYLVPADRRLAIEFASVQASRFLGADESMFVFIKTTVGGIEGNFMVGSISGSAAFADSRSVSLFADPGTIITTSQATRDLGTRIQSSVVCLSGRLMPI